MIRVLELLRTMKAAQMIALTGGVVCISAVVVMLFGVKRYHWDMSEVAAMLMLLGFGAALLWVAMR